METHVTHSVEHYKKAHTVTKEDHEQGNFTKVAVGDVVVFNVKKVTTVEEEAVSVDGDVQEDKEASETPAKEEKKTTKKK